MVRTWLTVMVCALGTACLARAENTIYVWEHTGLYSLDQDNKSVTIMSAGRFKIVALGDLYNNGLGDISSIQIAGTVFGTVELYVAGGPVYHGDEYNELDPSTHWGAEKVGMIGFATDSQPVGTTLNLDELRVAKDLGLDAVRDTRVTNVSGAVLVGENVRRDFYVSGTLSPAATVVLIYLDEASLHLTNPNTTHAGSIESSSVGLGRTIDVAGNMSGSLKVGHIGCINCNLTGLVHVAGSAHTILIDGVNLGNGMMGQVQVGTLLGYLEAAYDVARVLPGPSIAVDNLLGEIRVYGALRDNPNAAVEVQIGSMGSAAALTVDWDGYNPNQPDRWDPGAAVAVGDPNNPNHLHYGNDPDDRLYEVATCRGDCNNSGAVDFDDIDPFILAVSDPAGYADAFPGLSGSWLYHADCNGDGLVNFDDVDAFIAQIGNCPGGGEMMTASQLATGIRAHMPAARLPAVRAFVSQVIAHHANHPLRAAYWREVLALLDQ